MPTSHIIVPGRDRSGTVIAQCVLNAETTPVAQINLAGMGTSEERVARRKGSSSSRASGKGQGSTSRSQAHLPQSQYVVCSQMIRAPAQHPRAAGASVDSVTPNASTSISPASGSRPETETEDDGDIEMSSSHDLGSVENISLSVSTAMTIMPALRPHGAVGLSASLRTHLHLPITARATRLADRARQTHLGS